MQEGKLVVMVPVIVKIIPPNLNFCAINFLFDLKTSSNIEIIRNADPIRINVKGKNVFFSMLTS